MSKQQEREKALGRLREALSPGDTVHTILRHVSASGMTRDIDLVVLRDGEPVRLGWWAAVALNYRQHNDGIRVSGAGMDMGFHLVYNLARAVFADGFHCTGQRDCPANDHVNDRKPDYTAGRTHSDPGYALRHRWL